MRAGTVVDHGTLAPLPPPPTSPFTDATSSAGRLPCSRCTMPLPLIVCVCMYVCINHAGSFAAAVAFLVAVGVRYCWLLAAGCLLKKKKAPSHLNRLGTPPRLFIHSLLVGRRTTSWSHTHTQRCPAGNWLRICLTGVVSVGADSTRLSRQVLPGNKGSFVLARRRTATPATRDASAIYVGVIRPPQCNANPRHLLTAINFAKEAWMANSC